MNQLMYSFHGLLPPPDILAGVKSGQIGAFCLFAYLNVGSPAQVRDLTSALYQAAQAGGFPPPIIGIDQEGGQLIAIRGGATELPGNMALGATRSPELAEKAGRVLGAELLAMGINLNFAPSLDVNSNPNNPVIGIRSFGDDPDMVAELGIALMKGMHAEGVISTIKHFPGHGDTQSDSHDSAPLIPRSLEEIRQTELKPFQKAIHAGANALITAHVILSSIDPDVPATLSPKILGGLLREEMGFTGLVITDAMDMHGVARYGQVESLRAAIQAGNDLLLMGHLPDQLSMHAKTADLTRPESLTRIDAFRQRIPRELPPLSVVGCAEHQAIAQEIADRSITQVRGKLPLNLNEDDLIMVITPQPRNLTPADTSKDAKIGLEEAIRAYHPKTIGLELPYEAHRGTIEAILKTAEAAQVVIVGTINATQDPQQIQLVRTLHEQGKKPIVIALRTPYDLSVFPMIETYLCTYSIRPVSITAVVKVLFGVIPAQGSLPCHIPDRTEPYEIR